MRYARRVCEKKRALTTQGRCAVRSDSAKTFSCKQSHVIAYARVLAGSRNRRRLRRDSVCSAQIGVPHVARFFGRAGEATNPPKKEQQKHLRLREAAS